MLYSQADSKKKSNLMMSLFEPGPDPLPWLGKITHLGPISGNPLPFWFLCRHIKQANSRKPLYCFPLNIKGLSVCVHNQAVNHLHSFYLAGFDRDTDLTLMFNFPGISEAAENPYGEDDSKSPFPLQPPVKRSYAQNVTVWIKASGLQVQ